MIVNNTKVCKTVNKFTRFMHQIDQKWRFATENRGSGDEYESFVKKTGPKKVIPSQAKKSILIACLLVVLGVVELCMFIASFIIDSNMNGGRWGLLVMSLLITPIGAYTLYLARLIYKGTPGYHWSMIFH